MLTEFAPARNLFSGRLHAAGPSPAPDLRPRRKTAAAMIQMFNVTKVYAGGQPALRDVTLKVDKGEFALIAGPSGAASPRSSG
jgi:ABC-type multidrug transport system fused ATPase/permease subunit